jgi:hypothetical protein
MSAVEHADVSSRLSGVTRLWVVRLQYQWDPVAGFGEGRELFVRWRFAQTAVWHPTGFTVALYVANTWTGGG